MIFSNSLLGFSGIFRVLVEVEVVAGVFLRLVLVDFVVVEVSFAVVALKKFYHHWYQRKNKAKDHFLFD